MRIQTDTDSDTNFPANWQIAKFNKIRKMLRCVFRSNSVNEGNMRFHHCLVETWRSAPICSHLALFVKLHSSDEVQTDFQTKSALPALNLLRISASNSNSVFLLWCEIDDIESLRFS